MLKPAVEEKVPPVVPVMVTRGRTVLAETDHRRKAMLVAVVANRYRCRDRTRTTRTSMVISDRAGRCAGGEVDRPVVAFDTQNRLVEEKLPPVWPLIVTLAEPD